MRLQGNLAGLQLAGLKVTLLFKPELSLLNRKPRYKLVWQSHSLFTHPSWITAGWTGITDRLPIAKYHRPGVQSVFSRVVSAPHHQFRDVDAELPCLAFEERLRATTAGA